MSTSRPSAASAPARLGLILSWLLFAICPASAAPLSPWGVPVAPGAGAVTQYVYVNGGGLSGSTYLQGGLADGLDLIGGLSYGAAGGSFAGGPVEFMPRYFFTDSVGVAVRAASTTTPGALELGPEVHAAWAGDRFAFTANVGWRPLVGGGGSLGYAFGYLAPELLLGDHLSVYVEVNPTLTLEKPEFSLSLVPGVGLLAGGHAASLGVILPTADLGGWLVGAWYGYAWGG